MKKLIVIIITLIFIFEGTGYCLRVPMIYDNKVFLARELKNKDILIEAVRQNREALLRIIIKEKHIGKLTPKALIDECILARDDLARRILYLSNNKAKIILHLSTNIFGSKAVSHAFLIAVFSDGNVYFLDTTFPQFFYRPKSIKSEYGFVAMFGIVLKKEMLKHTNWKSIIMQLKKNGYVKFDQDIVDIYKCLLEGSQNTRLSQWLDPTDKNRYLEKELVEQMGTIQPFKQELINLNMTHYHLNISREVVESL